MAESRYNVGSDMRACGIRQNCLFPWDQFHKFERMPYDFPLLVQLGKARYFHGFQIHNIKLSSLTRMLTSQINGSDEYAGRIREDYSFKGISVGQTKQILNSDMIKRDLTICSTDWLVMIWANLQYFQLAPTSTSR